MFWPSLDKANSLPLSLIRHLLPSVYFLELYEGEKLQMRLFSVFWSLHWCKEQRASLCPTRSYVSLSLSAAFLQKVRKYCGSGHLSSFGSVSAYTVTVLSIPCQQMCNNVCNNLFATSVSSCLTFKLLLILFLFVFLSVSVLVLLYFLHLVSIQEFISAQMYQTKINQVFSVF